MDPKKDFTTKGILQAEAGREKFKLSRYEPAEELRLYIQHYWAVEWDLRGHEPYRQSVLSHPNVNLVFEPGLTRVYGVWEGASEQLLQDQGSVFAVKFNPGGFQPFWKQSVSQLTGQAIPITDVFGKSAASLEKEIFACSDVPSRVGRINNFFLEHLPKHDNNVSLINDIVAALIADRGILKVEQLAGIFDISVRTLQRLFSKYVGVNPKGVIQRYRLHEVAENIEKGEAIDWLKLAVDMGYYDQAHFIKDFKAILGKSPEEYVRMVDH
ncbi:AraC family transcriptional regulator [Cohnella abietis]|uniref:AraC family transcriptional regulator n=1 Tax=Cohnella abietis TaxID=2507935 RepID=A0A3T1CYW9_9BACL|nr:helix-turn-helix domain-containing protein [Cohnella abietis]BBI31040.1 AraC family transcriptional regulator [Cohnella abietis]